MRREVYLLSFKPPTVEFEVAKDVGEQ